MNIYICVCVEVKKEINNLKSSKPHTERKIINKYFVTSTLNDILQDEKILNIFRHGAFRTTN